MAFIQAFRPGVSENLTAGAASTATTATAVGGQSVARVKAVDQPIRVNLGPGTPTVGVSSVYLTAGETEYFLLHPGDRVAVIRAGAVDGAVNVSFMTR